MMWSPVEAQGSPAGGNTFSQATPPRAPAAAASFEAVDGRQQSAAASDRLEQSQLQQAAQRLFEQQANRAATTAAAAVDLPSDDSAESIAELLTDLSASGSRVQPAPEAEAVAGLRAAVEQLSTAEKPMQHQQQQQASMPPARPSTQQEQQAADQQPAAVSGFVFGSPDNASSAAGAARPGGVWVSSPAAAAGVTPTTLFDMSPLKASLSDIKGAAGAAAGPMPQSTAATAAAVTGAFAAPPAYASGSAAGAAAGGSAVAGGAPGGFSFTPGKGSKPGGRTPGAARASARGKKQTPSKARAQPAAGDSAAAGLFSAAGTAEPAAAATAASAADKLNGPFAAARPQQQQQQAAPTFGAAFFSRGTQPQPGFQPQQQQPAGASGVPTPRRKLHATQRRPQPASQQQQQPAGGHWPPATSAPAPNVSFTLGSSSRADGGTPVKSPRKGNKQQATQQPQQQPQPQPRMQQPVTDAQRARQFAAKCSEEAKASWNAKQYGAAAEKFSQVGLAAVWSNSSHCMPSAWSVVSLLLAHTGLNVILELKRRCPPVAVNAGYQTHWPTARSSHQWGRWPGRYVQRAVHPQVTYTTC